MKDNGSGTRKLAESAASLVAGAQQQLSVKNTAVIIGQRRYRMASLRRLVLAARRTSGCRACRMVSRL